MHLVHALDAHAVVIIFVVFIIRVSFKVIIEVLIFVVRP